MSDRSQTSPLGLNFARTAQAAAIVFVCALGPVHAQEARVGDDPVTNMLKWRPTAPPKDMPDFVRNSRAPDGQMNFTPLTGQEPSRPKRMTPDELAGSLKKFDAAAAANRAKAARAFGAARPAARRPAKRAAAN